MCDVDAVAGNRHPDRGARWRNEHLIQMHARVQPWQRELEPGVGGAPHLDELLHPHRCGQGSAHVVCPRLSRTPHREEAVALHRFDERSE